MRDRFESAIDDPLRGALHPVRSPAAITEPGRPAPHDVRKRLRRVAQDARGVDQGPALYVPFDPLLHVLVEPVEAYDHGRSCHLVQYEIVQTSPRIAGKVEP